MSRTEQVKKRLDGVGAEWTTWLEADVVAHFGDADAEYRAVRDGGAGLVDWSVRDTLVLSGPDAIPWFQGLVTSDLMELREEGAGQLTAVVNRIGRFIAEARALHMPEVLVLDLEPNLVGRGLITHLRRHVITEDVTIENRSETTARLHLAGEAAASVLDDLCETHRPVAELDAYHGTWGELGSEGVVIQRVDWTGEPGFDVSCASDAAHRIFNALYGRDEVEPVGFEPLETMRIEAGMPRFGAELNDAYIPLESGLDHAISFDKGCYLGQEIIARLDSRGTPARKLRALVFDGGAAPRVGDDVEREERSVGEVVSSAWSPLLQAPLAMAYIKRGHNEPGTEVAVGGRTARVERTGFAMEAAEQAAQ